jgi:chitodextrinase
MSKYITAFFMLFSCILVTAQVAHYTFDDGTAADVSSNGRNGTLQNGATIAGTNNKYLLLDGSNDRVDLGTWEISGNQMSISVWAWLDTNQNDQRIISKSTDTSNQNWALFVRTQGDIGFRITPQGGGLNGIYTEANYTMPTGEWVHLVTTYDGSVRKIYANGIERVSGAFTGDIQTGTQRVVIGDNEPSGSRPWNGKIDDVRVYDRALTPNEIGELYLLVPEGAPEPDTTPPTDPTLIDATATFDRAYISWTASLDESTVTYIIFRDGLAVASTQEITYEDGNLQPLTQYNYDIVARDISGNESNPLSFSVTTTDIPPLPPRAEFLEVYRGTPLTANDWNFIGESGIIDSSTIRITESEAEGTFTNPESHWGAAWYKTPMTFTDFWNVTFDLVVTNDNVNGLDYTVTGGGMAFVIQNNQELGLNAIGEIGSDKNGILGLRESFSIVFDAESSRIYWVADGGFNSMNYGWGVYPREIYPNQEKFAETQEVYVVQIRQSQAEFDLSDGIGVSISRKSNPEVRAYNRWIRIPSQYKIDGNEFNIETIFYRYLDQYIPTNQAYMGFVGSGANNLTCRQEVSNIEFVGLSIPEPPQIIETNEETVNVTLYWDSFDNSENTFTVLSYGNTSRRLGMYQKRTDQPITFAYNNRITIDPSIGEYTLNLPKNSEWYFTMHNESTDGGRSAYNNEKRVKIQQATVPDDPMPLIKDFMMVNNGAGSFLAFNVGSDDSSRPDFYLGQELDLEASYNLLEWFFMQKVTYTGSLLIINDPEISYKPRKFYRLKLN